MRPFLLLSSRAEDEAAEGEYEAFLRVTGLPPARLRRVRMEAAPLPSFELDDYAGIFVGGGPFNSSDAPLQKSAVQHRVERELATLLDVVVARDYPFFGACYGVGTLGVHQGGVIDGTYAEPISAVRVRLTEEGLADPVLTGMTGEFDAFVGHKEAISELPAHAVLLAGSPDCPVQAFRIGRNVYATQFHPELDADGLCIRIGVYKHAGYFDVDQADELKAMAMRSNVEHASRILRAFVRRYAAAPQSPVASPVTGRSFRG